MNISSATAELLVAPMSVVATRVFRGPHLFSAIPMIQIELDLGRVERFPTDVLPGFAEALSERLPGLARHGCSYGAEGGFLRRMQEGTWLGHVAEHVALELQTVVGHRVTRGKTRSVKYCPGRYYVMYSYLDEDVGLRAGRLALQLIDQLLPEELRGLRGEDLIAEGGIPFDFQVELSRLRVAASRRALGPTTASLIQEAARRNIPFRRLDDSSLVALGQGCKQRRLRASCTDLTSEVGTEIAADKDLTKLLLDQAEIPVPKGELVHSYDEACVAAKRLGYPVVTKPLDGNHGRGVSIDLVDAIQLRAGFEKALAHSATVIVERFFTGADHRILVVGGNVVAVAERVPAHVVGDGISPIRVLIDRINSDPRRGEGHSSVLTRIEMDESVTDYLARSGLTVEHIPAYGEMVTLLPTANLSTGGTAIDRTDEIHPENALIASRAAQIVGLDIAGIDFVCPDIRKPAREIGGGIIEVNAGPGFRMHLVPFQGRPRNVARPVLDLLFPKGSTGRIPIFAITGTNGKSTTARMLEHILRQTGVSVGLTATTGIYLNGHRIVSGDCSGPRSARVVLAEPSVEVAVLECARGGILREGLAFDECDVGAVLNVSADHLGLKGVETVEDLAAVKSVVAESVRNGGWSVLNADNDHTARMAKDAGGTVCYFSLKAQADWPDFLKEHVDAGGRAVVREKMEGGWDIVIHENNEAIYLMKVAEMPATFAGAAEFNVANAIAAIAMAHCHNVPLTIIRAGMRTFTTSFDQSPGRMNVYDAPHGVRTIVDYCHNPDGLREVGKFIDSLRDQFGRVVGVVGVAGDRRDADIVEMGALAAATFDELVFKEDDDTRGRTVGAVSALLMEGALGAGAERNRLHVVLSERDAVDFALRQARSGDLVFMAVDDSEATWRQVGAFRPDAASSSPRDHLHLVEAS